MRYLFIFCYRSVSELGYNECTMIFLNNSSLFFYISVKPFITKSVISI